MISFIRFLNTIRFLQFNQILGRLTWHLKNKIIKPFIIWKTSHLTQRISVLSIKKLNLSPRPASVCSYQQNITLKRFNFLNREDSFPDGIDWNSKNHEKLWLYNLHYFEYLIPFTHHISAENYRTGKTVINDWITKNPIGFGVGWEPYPLSLRIVNWVFFYDSFIEFFREDPEFNEQYLQNLLKQSYYLSWFIEYHIQANHLFENYKSLFIAGIFFQNLRIFKKYLHLLNREIQEQILPDGGHYERSPMYHNLILIGLLDIVNFLKRLKNTNAGLSRFGEFSQPFLRQLKIFAEKMIAWAQIMRHPDGDIPLFGDSAFGVTPEISVLDNYYREITELDIEPVSDKSIHPLPASGYYVFHWDKQYLAIDGGKLGVDYQPGHAHCDFLSFEYSFDKMRYFVDSGVGEYLPTDLRHRARGIYSHNTVVVNITWSRLKSGKLFESVAELNRVR